MKPTWFVIIACALVLCACSTAGQPNGPAYVIVTMALDTPVPFRNATFPPTETHEPSQTPTPTITPSATPMVGCVTTNSIFVHSGPALDTPRTGGLLMGNCITVLAYSADHQWAQFDAGWVSVQYLDFSHLTIDQELTIAAGATTTPTPTPIPTVKK